MQFPNPLLRGKFIKRYKRFFADVLLDDGTQITAHCANTGSMRNCIGEGWEVLVSTSDNPKRKLAYTLEFSINPQGQWIGLNTGLANKLVEEALLNRQIPSLAHYTSVRREVKYGEQNSRVDFLLQQAGHADCYLEVKSATLLEQQQGYFPDAETLRGQKHLQELAQMILSGQRAVLVFLAQHAGIQSAVQAAAHIDARYAALLAEAEANGLQVITLSCCLSGQKYFVDQVVSDSGA